MSIGESLAQCALDGSKLAQFDDCDQMSTLSREIFQRNLETDLKYFIGLFVKGFDSYHERMRNNDFESDAIDS